MKNPLNNPLTIKELLTEGNYQIPLYQRNFAWERKEIEQLISDVFDSCKEGRKEYFIGTLVVAKNEEKPFSIIDGQQRFTALVLLALVVQNEFLPSPNEKIISQINLSFQARSKSNKTLEKLLANEDCNEVDCELYTGYKTSFDLLKEKFVSSAASETDIDTLKRFMEYLLGCVKIFVSELPSDLDVNLYFERFNSRGEQLESHEIIKSELMQRLNSEQTDQDTIRKFAKIWDACSEFDTPCILFFKKKTKKKDEDEDREKIFGCVQTRESNTWQYGYAFDDTLLGKITLNNENKKSLFTAIATTPDSENSKNDDESAYPDDFNKYRCVVNFNTFLYYVLGITDNVDTDKLVLDDKKLLNAFQTSERNKDWILQFGRNLLKAKFIFDNFIIRMSNESNHSYRRQEGEWFLQKAYREDSNYKKREDLYVQTRFDQNSFGDKFNKEILMMQSMFACSFTAYRDSKWLYSTMKFLFKNSAKLNDENFGKEFYEFMKKLAVDFACERFCQQDKENGWEIDKAKLRYGSVPVYAFNFTDFVLWENRNSETLDLKKIKSIADFQFSYRNSIEHWYPQNPNESEKDKKMKEELLHSFANLCVIVNSQNSKFGNLNPHAKLDQWEKIIETQSIKLQIMGYFTKIWKAWDETKEKEILALEDAIIKLLNNFIKKSTPVPASDSSASGGSAFEVFLKNLLTNHTHSL